MIDYLRLLKVWNMLRTFKYKNINEIKEYQFNRFKRIVTDAYEHVPMYHTLYNSKKFHPSSLHSFEDIEKVPILTKDYIRKFPIEKRVVPFCNPQKIHKETTSGSTGEPIEIWTDSTESLIQAIKGIRFLREWGYSPFDNTVQLWRSDASPKKSVVQKLGLLKREIVSIMDRRDVVIRNLMKSKCDVLFAVRSSLEIFGEELKKRNLRLRPRILVSGSEMLTGKQRLFFKEVYGCETLEIYGTVETGNIAWGCPENPTEMHIDMETVVVNFTNIKQVSSEYKEASIIVTNLENEIMPFIRFDPGDLILLNDNNKCTCGRTLLTLGTILGRNDDILEYKGRKYNFHFFYNYFKNFLYIRRYQVVRSQSGEIIFKVKLESDTNESRERCVFDLTEAFQDRFDPLYINFVDEFLMAKSGKIKALVNE